MSDFVDPESFLPVGYVPMYWKKSKDQENFRRFKADMNLKQNTFILKIYARESKTMISNVHTGPFTLYDENDVQNLISLSRFSSTNISKLNMVENKSLLCNYEG